ncbi:MAG TPA: hypothetical protein VNI20_09720 [Fimbriimonadaceae bacterium]|nr:hypothetical protein [Fimbriimonadaceae bacterium]
MADVIATHAELARAGVDKFFPIFSQNQRRLYRKVGWHNEKTTQEFIRMYQEGGFGYAPQVTEATPIPTDTFATVNNKDYYWVKRGLGWKTSFEALETDQYGVTKRVAKKMAKAMEMTKESTAANVFNNATSIAAEYVGPDGKALIAVDHPYNGGTWSNRGVGALNTDVDLSVLTLEQAVEKNMDVVNYRGIPDPVTGPYKLFVPTGLAGLANRLAKSQLLPAGSDNDTNWAGGLVTEVIPNPWFTDPDAWFLVSANQDEHGLFVLTHGGRRVSKKLYEDTEEVAFFLTEKWLFHHMDARGVWGTPGV